jgi:hypothetical protein
MKTTDMPNDILGASSLTETDFKVDGTAKTISDDVIQVVDFVKEADDYITKNLWKSGIKESDLLYQSPQPFTTYSNSFILEPNVRRFVIARDVNSIVPQFYKGLLYEEPCFMLRPTGGATQEVAGLKRDIMTSFLRKTKFNREVKLGMEQQVLMGTGIWQYGISCVEEVQEHRISKLTSIEGSDTPLYSDKEPTIEKKTVERYYPTFESIGIDKIFVDPKLAIPDISEACEVAKQKFLNYYDILELRKDDSYTGLNYKEDGSPLTEEDIKDWFAPGGEGGKVQISSAAQAMQGSGVVMHAANPAETTANPLMAKLELLEYWNKVETKSIFNRKHCIRKMDNPWKIVPFLSANYWNVRENFWGIGVGLIAGGDQRVQAGTVGAALKLLTFKVNAPYMRNADANPPSQTIQTGLGRVLSVADVTKAYKLMETPDVPDSLWTSLSESRAASESSTGADQMLVGGSTAGPRTSMGRTAGGASILAGASATRLDGPLDNFIDQVFIPWLYILDKMIMKYVSDQQIIEILGKKRGKNLIVDMQAYHDYEADYDVLAGAKLAARAAMAQSLILIFQLLNNPQIQQNTADINGEIIDFKPLIRVLFEVSQWGSGIENDIFKPMSAAQKQQHDSKNPNAQKLQQTMAVNQQKFAQKQQLNDQESDNRIKESITRDAFKSASLGEAETGVANPGGFGGDGLSVQ